MKSKLIKTTPFDIIIKKRGYLPMNRFQEEESTNTTPESKKNSSVPDNFII